MPFDLFNEVNTATLEDENQAVERLSLQGMPMTMFHGNFLFKNATRTGRLS